MDFYKYIQPAFAAAIISIAILLFFFKIPAENGEYFKIVLTAIISFISGVAVATATISKSKETSTNEKINSSTNN